MKTNEGWGLGRRKGDGGRKTSAKIAETTSTVTERRVNGGGN